MAITFKWDFAKEESNIRKHGVNFTEAVEVLCDSLVLTVVDHRHHAEEKRFLSVGESRSGRVLTVAHTDEDDVVRIISARVATRSERRDYENG